MEIQLISNDELYHFNPYHDDKGRFASKIGGINTKLGIVTRLNRMTNAAGNIQYNRQRANKMLNSKSLRKQRRGKQILDKVNFAQKNIDYDVNKLIKRADELGYKVIKYKRNMPGNDSIHYVDKRDMAGKITRTALAGPFVDSLLSMHKLDKPITAYKVRDKVY